MKRVFLLLLIFSWLSGGALFTSAQEDSVTPEDACATMTTDGLALDNVQIDVAQLITDDPLNPSYCLVQGRANERTGIDGKTYAIGFEMRLPTDWNGRFLYQQNGGSDGEVVAATGQSNAANGVSALERGFAILSTNAGHNGADPINAEMGLVGGVAFGLDPQARLDYGYMSTETMTPIANTIIQTYYGEEPTYAYMFGCSNGGRHGMVTASRYPDYFDGILIGAPGFNLPRAAVQHAWDIQSFQIANADIRQSFSAQDMTLAAQHVVTVCDALDGAVDGMVADMKQCQTIFDLSDLTCEGEKNDVCLTSEQVTALNRAMGGPINSAGEQLYSDWPYDSGIGTGDWRFWKIESPIPPWDNYPLIATMGGGSLAYVFTTPPTELSGDPASLIEYLSNFDFDVDAPKIYATDDVFSVSPMEATTPLNVDNPSLTDFEASGGKLIIYHGQSDAVFSANDIVNWYERLNENHEGNADEFARLFMVPGMNHCSSGPSTDQFDALTALMSWVEEGKAPDSLIASVNPSNLELPTTWSASRTRPLCPWPMIAKYVGDDIESAESFECALP